MKNRMAILLSLLFVNLVVNAAQSPNKNLFEPKENNPLESNQVAIGTNNNRVYHQGCCSWHQGVCGCEKGKAICCDRTLSQTCGCD